jgi:dTDP-4-amino-4,6-dideoxygalactose transaminase
MRRLRSHGITREPAAMTHAPDGPWYYQQLELGFNYRMSELHGALGLSQLSRLDAYVARRHEIAGHYDRHLAGLSLNAPHRSADAYSAFHLYVVTLQGSADAARRLDIFQQLRAKGIGVNVHYIPVHTQPFYRRMGFREGDFPNAEACYARALSLPLFPGLSRDEVQRVVGALEEVLA